MSWENLLKAPVPYTLKDGTTVKTIKGMRFGVNQTNNIVEGIHEIVKTYGPVSAKAVVGYLYDFEYTVKGKSRKLISRAIPDRHKITGYLRINSDIYEETVKGGEYQVI